MLNNFLRALTELIFPNNCLACKKYFTQEDLTGCLCSSCYREIELNKPPFCVHCSRYLQDSPKNSLCRQCAHQVFAFDRAWGATHYNPMMKKLIHLFKYHGKTSLKTHFVRLIDNFVQTYHVNVAQYDVLVSIPLHPTRLRERGYNQSQLISEQLKATYKMRDSVGNLVRIRNTKNQAKDERSQHSFAFHAGLSGARPWHGNYSKQMQANDKKDYGHEVVPPSSDISHHPACGCSYDAYSSYCD